MKAKTQKLYDKIYADIYKLRDQIKKDVKEAGGFVMTNNDNRDSMYLLVCCGEDSSLEVVALAVEDNELVVYTAQTDYCDCGGLTKEEILNGDDVFRWSLNGYDDLWLAQTILDIAECYEEYLNK